MGRQLMNFGAFCMIFITFGVVRGDFERIPVCTNTSEQLKPDIRGNFIFWIDKRSAVKIYGYDIANPQLDGFVVCDRVSAKDQLRADDNIVVWRDGGSGSYDIWGASTGGATSGFLIYSGTKDQQTPAVSGNNIVWRENRIGNNDIYGINSSNSQN